MNTPVKSEIDILQSFVKKKNAQENQIAQEAQKLVNLYRNLFVFRPSFITEFNEMLLSSSKEVQMIMSSIVGGPAVRQYLEYLQIELHQKTTDDTQDKVKTIKGYLPSPEEDISADKTETSASVLAQAVNNLETSTKQQSLLLNQTIQAFQKEMATSSTDTGVTAQELKQIQQETLEKTLEKMVYLQTDLFSKMVFELTKALKAPNGLQQAINNNSTAQTPKQQPIAGVRSGNAVHAEYSPNKSLVRSAPQQTPQKHIPNRAPFVAQPQKKPFVAPTDTDVEILSEIDLSHK